MSEISPPWPGYRTAPERLNLASEVLGSTAAADPSRVALVGEQGQTTYDSLEHAVNRVAAGLRECGVAPGDRILIQMGNSVEFAAAFLGAVKLGAIPALVNSLLTAAELRPVIEQTQPKLIFTQASRAEPVRELRRAGLGAGVVCAGGGAAETEIAFESLGSCAGTTVPFADTQSGEPAFVVYTSGTTGVPKGIVHAHRWIVAAGDLNRYRLPPQPDDVVLATGEWSFISALGHNLLFPLRNRVAGAVLSSRATPENILAAVAKFRVSVLHSVATVYRRLLAMPGFENEHDLGSLRYAHSTGEALREATYTEWKRRVGSELFEHYGVSEYQLVIGHGARHPVKPGSVGKPLPGVDVGILDDELRPVAAGDIGQFAISTRDPELFLGYYKDPARTAAAIRSGWYLTGDLAYQDSDGYVFIAGRRDDCFKSRGIFISPTELENALQKHPAVVEAAVVPEPDPDIGNRIRALVVLAQGNEASEELLENIRSALRLQLAPYKIPHTIDFTETLPKSALGKILRAAL